MPKNYPMSPTTERPTDSLRDLSTAFPKMRPDSSGSALKTGSTDSTDTTSSTTTSPTAEPYTPFIRTTKASSGWAPGKACSYSTRKTACPKNSTSKQNGPSQSARKRPSFPKYATRFSSGQQDRDSSYTILKMKNLNNSANMHQ